MRPSKVDRKFSVGEVIEGGGGLFTTSSMFYRTELAKIKPDFYDIVPNISDYPLVINLSLLGTVYYMEKAMSSYRVGDKGSWTANNLSDKMKKKPFLELCEATLSPVEAIRQIVSKKR